MKELLKKGREVKQLKTREVAQLLGIDQALVSKFENGSRKPTKEQISKLATLYQIDHETLLIAWLKEKILAEIGTDEIALKALQASEAFIKNSSFEQKTISQSLQKIILELDQLKKYCIPQNNTRVAERNKSIALAFTYESNRMDGNTLSLEETQKVINQGVTISGKSMRENLEAINHNEAISYCKLLLEKGFGPNERELLALHHLILRGILPEEAGRYRTLQVAPQNTPPQNITTEIEACFVWYENQKNKLHPVILAAEMHLKIMTIYPFIEGNGKVARLVMNLILWQNQFATVHIAADFETKNKYTNALATQQKNKNSEDFVLFIAQKEKESLEHFKTANR